MYRRPSNLLLALGGHYEGKNHSNIDRQNEMDSCIKWMRPSSLQDLGYTTVYYTYGALCPTFPQIHDKKKTLAVSATRKWQILDHLLRMLIMFPYVFFSNMSVVFVVCVG